MTKSLLAPIALLSTLLVAAPGCADHPPASSLSSELTVLQMADELGYNSTKVVNGTVIYCQHEQMTGSMVPKEDCISADAVKAEQQSRDGSLRNFRKAPKVEHVPPRSGA
jgi:hypothetical protein